MSPLRRILCKRAFLLLAAIWIGSACFLWRESAYARVVGTLPVKSSGSGLYFSPRHRHPRSLKDLIRAHGKPFPVLVQANAGVLDFLLNMECSLQRVEAAGLDNVIVWATDQGVYRALHDKWTSAALSNSSILPFRPLGLFWEEAWQASGDKAPAGSKAYFDLMGLRPRFFVHLLTVLKTPFAFIDTDIVFFDDFTEALTRQDESGVYGLPADLTYSTDAKRFYQDLEDPYEDQLTVPKICGGFFLAQRNARTTHLYTLLRDLNLNDQWGMNDLLNGKVEGAAPSVLVDPLPAGLTRRFEPPAITSDMLRVRILDQAEHPNGVLWWNYLNPDRIAKWGRWGSLKQRKRTLVSLHTNIWKQDKRAEMKKRGIWLLDDELRCLGGPRTYPHSANLERGT